MADATGKTERKEAYKKKMLKQAISAYRRNLDRMILGKAYAEQMGILLINVLADLEGLRATRPSSPSRRCAMRACLPSLCSRWIRGPDSRTE